MNPEETIKYLEDVFMYETNNETLRKLPCILADGLIPKYNFYKFNKGNNYSIINLSFGKLSQYGKKLKVEELPSHQDYMDKNNSEALLFLFMLNSNAQKSKYKEELIQKQQSIKSIATTNPESRQIKTR